MINKGKPITDWHPLGSLSIEQVSKDRRHKQWIHSQPPSQHVKSDDETRHHLQGHQRIQFSEQTASQQIVTTG